MPAMSPFQDDTRPYAASTYSLSDTMSVASESSTLRSMKEDGDTPYNRKPSMDIDSTYLSDKVLPDTPLGHKKHRAQSHHRSRSPGHRRILSSSRGLQSPHPATSAPEKTQMDELAGVLGPDGVPHTTELDSIPCAGIRIPNGLFSGLLAWRLVIRVHSRKNMQPTPASLKKELSLLPKTDIRHAGNMPHRPIPSQGCLDGNATIKAKEEKKKRRMSFDAVQTLGRRAVGSAPTAGVSHERPTSEYTFTKPFAGRFGSGSATSLPLMQGANPRPSLDALSMSSDEDDNEWNVVPPSGRPWGPASSSTPALVNPVPASPSGMAEGSSSSLYQEESHGLFGKHDSPRTVSLYIQDVAKPITFRLAPAGEPSRLGVQFLLESDVNVCMGEGGRGAILWSDPAEKRRFLHDVPRTVPLPKQNLQAKVRALFGL
ncbi:hypothetical protein DFP72DRAFT_461679 [Ephemerocybe angulata]|uniref:Uncharacterized protein n=1 Tax=Ephemerocybe angulata TaxID=980116 RepID=A0A8H6M4L6_9AGAR|nr:hypothetical protein DFP72DRAFT_461679 [Tulosesus angulatus]